MRAVSVSASAAAGVAPGSNGESIATKNKLPSKNTATDANGRMK
jgi:hypothetical protein